MDSGMTHKHVAIIDINKYMEFKDINGTTMTNLNKFTKMVFALVKAFPLHQAGATPATALTSAAPFRVDFIVHYTINWRRVNIPKKKDEFVQNGVTLLGGPYSYEQADTVAVPSGTGDL